DIALHVGAGADACESVFAVDVHGAGAAYSFAAGAAKSQRGVDLILDLDENIQDHGPAVIHIHFVAVQTRILGGVGVEPVDLEQPRVFCAGRSFEHPSVLAN